MSDNAAAAMAIIGLLGLGTYLAMLIIVGRQIGASRGRADVGIVLSLFFGPLGWLITAFLPRTAEAEARHQAAVAEKLKLLQDQQPTPPTPPPTADPPVRPMFPDPVDADQERFATWRRWERQNPKS